MGRLGKKTDPYSSRDPETRGTKYGDLPKNDSAVAIVDSPVLGYASESDYSDCGYPDNEAFSIKPHRR